MKSFCDVSLLMNLPEMFSPFSIRLISLAARMLHCEAFVLLQVRAHLTSTTKMENTGIYTLITIGIDRLLISTEETLTRKVFSENFRNKFIASEHKNNVRESSIEEEGRHQIEKHGWITCSLPSNNVQCWHVFIKESLYSMNEFNQF